MKSDNAFFLLEAIGEISERTADEAKLPERGKVLSFRRRAAVLAASIVLLIAVSAALIFGLGIGRGSVTPTAPTESAPGDTVSIDDAVNTAIDTLKKSGVTAKLLKASFIADEGRSYYLVKLDTEDGTCDCTVDAYSGRVTGIAYDDSGTAKTDAPTVSGAGGANGESGQDTSDISDDTNADDDGTSDDSHGFGETPKTVYDYRSRDPAYNSSGNDGGSQGLSFELKLEEPKPMTNGSGSSDSFGLTAPKTQTNPYDTPIRWDMNLP